jgi:hypothetical protein
LNAWVDILFADFLKEDAVVEHYTIQDGGRFYVAVQKMIVNERSAEFTLLRKFSYTSNAEAEQLHS